MTDGFDVPSGFSASFGVKARQNVRVTKPHGNCQVSNPNLTHDYTVESCRLKCIQETIMIMCNCTDNRLPEVEWDGPRPPCCLELPKFSADCAVSDNSKLESMPHFVNIAVRHLFNSVTGEFSENPTVSRSADDVIN